MFGHDARANSATQSRLMSEGMSCPESYAALEAARAEGRSVGTATEERARSAVRIKKQMLDLALAPSEALREGARRVLIVEGMGLSTDFMSDRLQVREVGASDHDVQLPAQDRSSILQSWDGMARECISLENGTRPDRVHACKRLLCSGLFHAVILADASGETALRVLEQDIGPHLLSFVLAGGALAVTSCDASQVLGTLQRLFGVAWQRGGYYRTTWHPVADNASVAAECFPRAVATAPFSAKAVAVRGVPERERLFSSTRDSVSQSLVPFMAGRSVGKHTDGDSVAGAIEDFDVSVAVAEMGGHGGCVALFCDINMEVATVLQVLGFCSRRGARIPPDATAKLEDSEYSRAMELKGSGNAAFGKGEYDRALGLYREGLGVFGARSGGAGAQREERVKIGSNAAECCLKLEQWEGAALFAADALRDDSTHAKSRLRRAKAALALGRRKAARADLELLMKEGDDAAKGTAAALLRPIREEMKIEREATRRQVSARAAAALRGAGGGGNSGGGNLGGGKSGAGGFVRGARSNFASVMAGTTHAWQAAAMTPQAWAKGLSKAERHGWFIDCYRMRLDDDFTWGDCYLHGLYGKSNGQGGSITGDFLGFCKLAVRHGVVPGDGAWSWGEVLRLAGGKDSHGRAPLQCAFEKSDAKEKYGGENIFSAVTGGRSLRATAEVSCAIPSLPSLPPLYLP
jgi:tetratricopeptide (TPR) repeat protein